MPKTAEASRGPWRFTNIPARDTPTIAFLIAAVSLDTCADCFATSSTFVSSLQTRSVKGSSDGAIGQVSNDIV